MVEVGTLIPKVVPSSDKYVMVAVPLGAGPDIIVVPLRVSALSLLKTYTVVPPPIDVVSMAVMLICSVMFEPEN